MKRIGLIIPLFFIYQLIFAKVLHVPSQYPDVAAAVQAAMAGDTIELAKGTYKAQEITIEKAITVTGQEVTIDANGKVLFFIKAMGVTINGLTIINGDHPLEISARAIITNNHFINNRDAISMEGESGGYIADNLIENDRDDGIDCDIGDDAGPLTGSDIVITHNTILNSHDDGIEIRLFSRPNQLIHYDISHNTIQGSRNAGIQLISYDVPTGKIFNIHHNTIRHCKVGLGCMAGGRTDEDLNGAAKMEETVYLYSNTIVDNQLAATGGNHMIVHNNYMPEGVAHFGPRSQLANNQMPQRILDYTPVKENQYFNQDTIQAIRYQHSDGKIVKKDSMVVMEANAVLVYSVGTSGTHQYYIWCKARGEGNLMVTFDNQEAGHIQIEKAGWYKLPVAIKMTPGQWNLRLQVLAGTAEISEIVFKK